jgi:hypothetical protein
LTYTKVTNMSLDLLMLAWNAVFWFMFNTIISSENVGFVVIYYVATIVLNARVIVNNIEEMKTQQKPVLRRSTRLAQKQKQM